MRAPVLDGIGGLELNSRAIAEAGTALRLPSPAKVGRGRGWGRSLAQATQFKLLRIRAPPLTRTREKRVGGGEWRGFARGSELRRLRMNLGIGIGGAKAAGVIKTFFCSIDLPALAFSER